MQVLKSTCCLVALVAICGGRPASATEPGTPIRLAYIEGDVAGMSSILSEDGTKTIGVVEFRQRRRDDTIEAVRVARFSDGSSDEDTAVARIGATLRMVRGRSIIRNAKGVRTVDVTIDVAGGHISGFSGLGSERVVYDEHVELGPGVYWGAVMFLLIKNFDANANGESLVFRTVACTPKPRVVDMELVRGERKRIHRRGGAFDTVQFTMRPTVNWLVDPIIRALAPDTSFFVREGVPPALVRFEGVRNFAGQKVRIE